MNNMVVASESPTTGAPDNKGGFLTRPVGGSSRKRATNPKSAARATVLGAPPRADLLPPEVFEEHRQRARQRSLWIGVVGTVLVAVVGTGAAFIYNVTAAMDLVAMQDETIRLQTELGTHAEVRDIKANVATSEEAQRVGGSTDIDWKTYLTGLQATLPAGVVITSVDVETGSPITDYAQPTVPLEGARIGTLTFEATSPALPFIPDWLDGLETLDGFVDAVPNSVEIVESGGYTVSITMHIDAEAYSGRFAPEEEAK
jgi:hypothetical protein